MKFYLRYTISVCLRTVVGTVTGECEAGSWRLGAFL